MCFTVTILTAFPEMFPGYLQYSLAGKALQEGKWHLNIINIRDYGIGKHRQIDDTPYGGGAGMLMRVDVLSNALEDVLNKQPNAKTICFTTAGRIYNQQKAESLTAEKSLIIICPRFEGLDARLFEHYNIDQISLGDYIISGGELGAYTILDSCVRLIPEVMGNNVSCYEESFCNEFRHLLEYPQYTRPVAWKNKQVPSVLLTGNHKEIAKWRKRKAEEITESVRDDLWQRYKNDS